VQGWAGLCSVVQGRAGDGSAMPAAPPREATSSLLRRARLVHARTVLPGGAAIPSGEVVAALARRPDAGRLAADGLRRTLLAALARSSGLRVSGDDVEAALRAWLGRLGVPSRRREPFLAACGLDAAAARDLGEDLALEAAVLGMAGRFVPDGPSWEEGLALAARLTGAWVEEAARALDGRSGSKSRSRSRSKSRSRSRSGPRSGPKSRSGSKSGSP